jgi:hypothetical protein
VGCLGGYLGGRLHLVSLRVPVRIEQEGDYPEPPRRLTHQKYNNFKSTFLVQFYHLQDPCLNCASKNQKFRMFVYLLVQTKFQHPFRLSLTPPLLEPIQS